MTRHRPTQTARYTRLKEEIEKSAADEAQIFNQWREQSRKYEVLADFRRAPPMDEQTKTLNKLISQYEAARARRKSLEAEMVRVSHGGN